MLPFVQLVVTTGLTAVHAHLSLGKYLDVATTHPSHDCAVQHITLNRALRAMAIQKIQTSGLRERAHQRGARTLDITSLAVVSASVAAIKLVCEVSTPRYLLHLSGLSEPMDLPYGGNPVRTVSKPAFRNPVPEGWRATKAPAGAAVAVRIRRLNMSERDGHKLLMNDIQGELGSGTHTLLRSLKSDVLHGLASEYALKDTPRLLNAPRIGDALSVQPAPANVGRVDRSGYVFMLQDATGISLPTLTGKNSQLYDLPYPKHGSALGISFQAAFLPTLPEGVAPMSMTACTILYMYRTGRSQPDCPTAKLSSQCRTQSGRTAALWYTTPRPLPPTRAAKYGRKCPCSGGSAGCDAAGRPRVT